MALEVDNKVETYLAGLPGPVEGVIRPLLNPFLEAVDWVAGDPQDLVRAARAWTRAAQDVRGIADNQVADRADAAAAWTGLAADAFAAKLTKVEESMSKVAEALDGTSELLVEAAKGAVESANLIIDLIIDLILTLAANLLVSLALSAITFGASFAAAAANAAANAAAKLTKVLKIVQKLVDLLQKIEARLLDLITKIAKYRENIQKISAFREEVGKFSKLGFAAAGAKSALTFPVRAGIGQVLGETPPGGPLGGAINAGRDVVDYAQDDDSRDGR